MKGSRFCWGTGSALPAKVVTTPNLPKSGSNTVGPSGYIERPPAFVQRYIAGEGETARHAGHPGRGGAARRCRCGRRCGEAIGNLLIVLAPPPPP